MAAELRVALPKSAGNRLDNRKFFQPQLLQLEQHENV